MRGRTARPVRPVGPDRKAARAILETKCAACHGAARMSDLDLRERDTILKGGKRGPAIVPGKADESLLYKAVRREGDVQMPPGKTALTAAEVNAIRDWINAGAKWASHRSEDRGRATWWSFKKPVRPAVPAVKDASRVRNPIDAFILAKLEQKGLHLAPEADRAHPRPPRLFRPARPAAHARAGRRVRQRQVARRL